MCILLVAKHDGSVCYISENAKEIFHEEKKINKSLLNRFFFVPIDVKKDLHHS